MRPIIETAKLDGLSNAEGCALYYAGITNVADFWIFVGNDFEAGINTLASRTRIERERLLAILARTTGLQGIEPTEAERLFQIGIKNADDLWATIGSDPSNGIAQVSDLTGLSQERLIELLTIRGVEESRLELATWLERRWLDLVLVTGAIVLVLLGLRAAGVLARAGFPLGLHATFVAQKDIPKGKVIETDELTIVWWARQTGAVESPGSAVGHRTLIAVPQGHAILTESIDEAP